MLSAVAVPVVVVGLAVVLFGVLIVWVRHYVKCPPNEVLVVFGKKRKMEIPDHESGGMKTVERGYRLVLGGATFVVRGLRFSCLS